MPPFFLFGSQASGAGAVFPTRVDLTYLMGAGIAVRDPVFHSLVANTVDRADASVVASGRSFGFVTAINTPIPGSCTVRLVGEVGGFAGLTPGAAYLLGLTPGVIVESTDLANPDYPDNVGNVIQAVGYARTATTLQIVPAAVLQTV